MDDLTALFARFSLHFVSPLSQPSNDNVKVSNGSSYLF
jgi:hypothetical protein